MGKIRSDWGREIAENLCLGFGCRGKGFFAKVSKQSIIAGMSLFAVQMIGALCVGVAVALIAEPIVRHFFGNSEATIGISLLTGYASVPVSTYLVGLWWLKQYQLPRMEKPDRLFVKTVAAALPLVQVILFVVSLSNG